MSEFEHIYLYTGGLPVQEVAEQIAQAIGGRVTRDGDDVSVSRRMIHLPDGWVGGQVIRNPDYDGTPHATHPSVSDLYDITYDVWCTPRPDEFQAREAAAIFGDIVAQLSYPALLTRSYDWLVAAWAPAIGRTDFPPRTSPDEEDRALWQRYADPAAITQSAERP